MPDGRYRRNASPAGLTPMPARAPGARPTSGPPIRLFLVEDHRAVLEALASALNRRAGLTVVGTAGSVREVVEARGIRPDLAIVDYHLPDGTGADAGRQIGARWPGTRIVMLTASATEDEIIAAVRAGADAFLTKGESLARIVEVIRATMAGDPSISPSLLGRMAQDLADAPTRPALSEPLTSRELTVIRALAAGQSTRAIASELGISPGTVLRHVEAIRRKFNVHSRLEAVSEALRHHIVELPAA
jgi:DNA-binding NarL/FixJ family response regulator